MAHNRHKKLEEMRCIGCGKLLLKAILHSGTIEIDCHNSKCKTTNTWKADRVNKESESRTFSIRALPE